MSKNPFAITALAVTLSLGIAPAEALNPNADPAHVAADSEGFLAYHPDLRWRKIGLGHFEDGKLDKAFDAFKRSSHYADKGSQAMVAEMFWKGTGTAADRPAAYAWMDLAAERGYKDFAAVREFYWKSLSEEERERALQIGKEVYAEFGDDVAKPRLERMLNKGRRVTTGSRTGFKGALTIMLPGNGGWISLDAEQYYDKKFWQPELYFEWQDQIWREPYKGRVEVGEIAEARPADSSKR